MLKESICLNRFCKPIMTKPRPAPAKPATPETQPTPPPHTREQQQQGGDANANASPSAERAADDKGEVPSASAESMEAETSAPSA